MKLFEPFALICATIACAYLLASGKAVAVEEAVAWLRRVRPSIIIRPEALNALHAFSRRLTELAVSHAGIQESGEKVGATRWRQFREAVAETERLAVGPQEAVGHRMKRASPDP